MSKKQNNTKPIFSIRLGHIDAAIWENKAKKTGEVYQTVTLSRSYMDEMNQWQRSTVTVKPADLPVLSTLASKALEFILATEPPADPADQ